MKHAAMQSRTKNGPDTERAQTDNPSPDRYALYARAIGKRLHRSPGICDSDEKKAPLHYSRHSLYPRDEPKTRPKPTEDEKRHRNGNALTDILINLKTDEVLERFSAAPRQHESGRQRPATPNRRIRSRHGRARCRSADRHRIRSGPCPHGRPYRLCRQGGTGHDGRLLRAGPRQPRHRTPYPARKRAVGPLRLARLGRRRAGRCALFSAPRSRCGATN